MENRGTAPLILKLDTRWQRRSALLPGHFIFWEFPLEQMDRKLLGTQNCCGHTFKRIILYPRRTLKLRLLSQLSSSSQPGHYKDLSHIMGRKKPEFSFGHYFIIRSEITHFLNSLTKQVTSACIKSNYRLSCNRANLNVLHGY